MAALAAVVLLPVDLLDHGPTLCPIRRLGGTWCWGCGITRACWRVLHGYLRGAFEHNRLVVAVFPLVGFLYFRWAWRALRPATQGARDRAQQAAPPPSSV